MCAKKIIEEEEFEENIIERPLGKAVHEYMMPYAEYIILDRALPRVEDGLKPVQRRILYSMYELNLKPNGPYKKSARVVGDCLGKYHPHGDSSIYQAMVNMSQDFSMNETLVNGHGNFGSIDGDSAAAMRYTEVKLQPLACELLRDLEKGTVKWVKNFDDTMEEPDILPGRYPNLLVNGAMGIAIGLSTKIPPHNLTEVIDGTIAMIDNPKIDLNEMLSIIKGPDFPSGGYIERNMLEQLYTTGKASVVMAAKHDIETVDRGKQNIVITEIPYNVNKAELQKRILNLRDSLTEKKGRSENILAGITEIVDESDKNGIRIVIKLKNGEDAKKIIEFLYSKTDLQCNFNANMVAIADGRPQQLGLLQILSYYIKYQKDIITKRSKFDLNIAKKREHILDGFVIALPHIDEVIEIIKDSNSRTEARTRLKDTYSLTDIQADAILDMRLVSLTKMEINKIEKELRELKKKIEMLTKIINSEQEQAKIVKEELMEIRNNYISKRKTLLVDSISETIADPCEAALKNGKKGYVVIGAEGEIKFVNQRQFMTTHKDAISSGVDGLAKDVVFIDKGYTALVFSNFGKCYRLDTEIIKESCWTDKGQYLNELYNDVQNEEKAVSMIVVGEKENELDEIYIYTKYGMVKRSFLSDFIVNKDVYDIMVLKEGDEIISVEKKLEIATIVFLTNEGMCLNAEVSDFPLQGRKAGGVIGINLSNNNYVVFAGQFEGEKAFEGDGVDALGELVIVTNKGYAKRIIVSYIEQMKRNRKGVKAIDLSKDKNPKILFAGKVIDPYDIAFVDNDNKISIINTEEINIESRTTRGKSFIKAVGSLFAIKQIGE